LALILNKLKLLVLLVAGITFLPQPVSSAD
jgi:hypothetical protein